MSIWLTEDTDETKASHVMDVKDVPGAKDEHLYVKSQSLSEDGPQSSASSYVMAIQSVFSSLAIADSGLYSPSDFTSEEPIFPLLEPQKELNDQAMLIDASVDNIPVTNTAENSGFYSYDEMDDCVEEDGLEEAQESTELKNGTQSDDQLFLKSEMSLAEAKLYLETHDSENMGKPSVVRTSLKYRLFGPEQSDYRQSDRACQQPSTVQGLSSSENSAESDVDPINLTQSSFLEKLRIFLHHHQLLMEVKCRIEGIPPLKLTPVEALYAVCQTFFKDLAESQCTTAVISSSPDLQVKSKTNCERHEHVPSSENSRTENQSRKREHQCRGRKKEERSKKQLRMRSPSPVHQSQSSSPWRQTRLNDERSPNQRSRRKTGWKIGSSGSDSSRYSSPHGLITHETQNNQKAMQSQSLDRRDRSRGQQHLDLSSSPWGPDPPNYEIFERSPSPKKRDPPKRGRSSPSRLAWKIYLANRSSGKPRPHSPGITNARIQKLRDMPSPRLDRGCRSPYQECLCPSSSPSSHCSQSSPGAGTLTDEIYERSPSSENRNPSESEKTSPSRLAWNIYRANRSSRKPSPQSSYYTNATMHKLANMQSWSPDKRYRSCSQEALCLRSTPSSHHSRSSRSCGPRTPNGEIYERTSSPEMRNSSPLWLARDINTANHSSRNPSRQGPHIAKNTSTHKKREMQSARPEKRSESPQELLDLRRDPSPHHSQSSSSRCPGAPKEEISERSSSPEMSDSKKSEGSSSSMPARCESRSSKKSRSLSPQITNTTRYQLIRLQSPSPDRRHRSPYENHLSLGSSPSALQDNDPRRNSGSYKKYFMTQAECGINLPSSSRPDNSSQGQERYPHLALQTPPTTLIQIQDRDEQVCDPRLSNSEHIQTLSLRGRSTTLVKNISTQRPFKHENTLKHPESHIPEHVAMLELQKESRNNPGGQWTNGNRNRDASTSERAYLPSGDHLTNMTLRLLSDDRGLDNDRYDEYARYHPSSQNRIVEPLRNTWNHSNFTGAWYEPYYQHVRSTQYNPMSEDYSRGANRPLNVPKFFSKASDVNQCSGCYPDNNLRFKCDRRGQGQSFANSESRHDHHCYSPLGYSFNGSSSMFSDPYNHYNRVVNVQQNFMESNHNSQFPIPDPLTINNLKPDDQDSTYSSLSCGEFSSDTDDHTETMMDLESYPEVEMPESTSFVSTDVEVDSPCPALQPACSGGPTMDVGMLGDISLDTDATLTIDRNLSVDSVPANPSVSDSEPVFYDLTLPEVSYDAQYFDFDEYEYDYNTSVKWECFFEKDDKAETVLVSPVPILKSVDDVMAVRAELEWIIMCDKVISESVVVYHGRNLGTPSHFACVKFKDAEIAAYWCEKNSNHLYLAEKHGHQGLRTVSLRMSSNTRTWSCSQCKKENFAQRVHCHWCFTNKTTGNSAVEISPTPTRWLGLRTFLHPLETILDSIPGLCCTWGNMFVEKTGLPLGVCVLEMDHPLEANNWREELRRRGRESFFLANPFTFQLEPFVV